MESHTWNLWCGQLREARSQAGGAAACDYPKSPVTGSENETCELLPRGGFSKSGLHLLKRYLERWEEDGWPLGCIFCMSLRWWGRELTFLYFLFSYWRHELVYRNSVRAFFFGRVWGVWNKDSVCNLMPCEGSQLTFRAVRFIPVYNRSEMSLECQHQNTHRNHFKEAWIMRKALKSCSRLTVLTCRRWSVHGISGGLVLCDLLCGMGFCFLGCREDVEIESRPAPLARAAWHIKNIVVQS